MMQFHLLRDGRSKLLMQFNDDAQTDKHVFLAFDLQNKTEGFKAQQ